MNDIHVRSALSQHVRATLYDLQQSSFSQAKQQSLRVGSESIGCLLDPMGIPLRRIHLADEALHSIPNRSIPAIPRVPSSLARKPITKIFCTGIRAVDAFTTMGTGQRMAVFAAPGAGKSRLLASIAQNSQAQINVIGLIGERGREVQEFLDSTLPGENWGNTIAIASTSDQRAELRVQAAYSATLIASYFRDCGYDVLLLIDSLSRVARAYRDIGLAAGEAPVRRGYPASVFERLPRLLECPGAWARGSITAFYTLLLSDELDEDPIVEEAKSLVDGHIMLSRSIAERGCYPAIDINTSLSRLQNRLLPKEAIEVLNRIRRLSARHERDRDLAALATRLDEELLQAIALEERLEEFIAQDSQSRCTLQNTFWELERIYRESMRPPDYPSARLDPILDELSSDKD